MERCEQGAIAMKRTAVLVGFMLTGMLLMPHASAVWSATTGVGSTGRSTAQTLAAGSTPVATAPATSSNVTVSWTAQSSGAPAYGYEVRVYDATSGTPRTTGTGCAGLVTTTNCVETAAATGTWRYTITPRQQEWSGAESPRSIAIVIPA
jgi:hypothetical protein